MSFTIIRQGTWHECQVRDLGWMDLPPGTIVRCDECGQRWKRVGGKTHGRMSKVGGLFTRFVMGD